MVATGEENILVTSIIAPDESKAFLLTPSLDGPKLTSARRRLCNRSSTLNIDVVGSSTFGSRREKIGDHVPGVEESGVCNLLHVDEDAVGSS